MAETEQKQSNFESPFNADNIVQLKDAINKAINDHAVETTEKGKLDIFVILAALSQASYEVTVRTFPKDKEESKKSHDEMKLIADKLIREMDSIRKEHDTSMTGELLAPVHAHSITAEFYARRRDEYIQGLQDVQSNSGQGEAPNDIEE